MKDQCPKCGAPCATTVNMRGGDHGWGTTDAERTVYRFDPSPATPQAEPSFATERFMLDAHIDGMDQFTEFVLARDHDRIVHDLETMCDPAGLVRENTQLRDTNKGLQKMYRNAVATPPAAIPAAPSEAKKLLTPVQLFELAKVHGAYTTVANLGASITFRLHELVTFAAALTQPTTVQQAEQIPRELAERIVDRLRKAQIFHLASELEAALKTAQTTALPGGNGEGE